MQLGLGLHREADGAVEILAREVDAPLRRRHAHLDLGVLGLEAVQARRQPAQREGGDQADIEGAEFALRPTRSRALVMWSKASRRSGSSASPSLVISSPRGRRTNRATPAFLERFT
jgi:hypothetical protein